MTLSSLADALPLPVGSSVVIPADTEAQLLGAHGTLANRFRALCAQTDAMIRELTAQPKDLFPQDWSRWTLLTEHEHPTWPMLALARPPALNPTQTAHCVAHLLQARMPTHPAQLLRTTHEPLPDSWGALLARQLKKQASRAILPSWGILAAYVGLTQSRSLLPDLLNTPQLLHDPSALARHCLWNALTPLHGGLDAPYLLEETLSLLRLWSREPLPAPKDELLPYPRLAASLEAHGIWEAREMAALLLHELREYPDNQTGRALRNEPACSLYWLRRGHKVVLVVVTMELSPRIESVVWHMPTQEQW